MGEEEVPNRLVAAALEDILEWEELARSPSLQRFLRYVVEAKLDGRGSSIKAYSIAVDVFDRPADFNPQTDPIVRVQAGRLRKLLARFYMQGYNKVPVEISLPVGGYVPTVRSTGVGSNSIDAGPEEKNVDDAAVLLPTEPVSWRNTALILTGFSLAAIAVAIYFVFTQAQSADHGPTQPRLFISEFSNLTGSSAYDSAIDDIGFHLVTDIAQFDLVAARGNETVETAIGALFVRSDFRLSGVLRKEGDGVQVTAFLAHGESAESVWTMTLAVPDDQSAPDLSRFVGERIATSLGDHRGPLHAQTRDWMEAHPEPAATPTEYLCRMRYYLAVDSGGFDALEAAHQCAKHLMELNPGSAVALAIHSAVSAHMIAEVHPVDMPIEVALFDAVQGARRAVELQSNSSFAQEQLGRVLSLAGDHQGALRAFDRAEEINPLNAEIMASRAMMHASYGDFKDARTLADAALEAFDAAPPWFYVVPMLDAFRQGHYQEALFSAVTVIEGEPEIGLIVAVAAGALAARSDITQRYLGDLLAQSNLQRTGIMPWIEQRFDDPSLYNRLRLGLQLGGVPLSARDRPFSPKKPVPADVRGNLPL